MAAPGRRQQREFLKDVASPSRLACHFCRVPQDVIHPAEFETPRLNAGQAVVEVVAAPINPSDVMTLTGEYGQLPPLPAIGGREGVGRVAELGGDTRDVAVGQLVLLPVGCGSGPHTSSPRWHN